MTDSAHKAQRRALADIFSRRSVLGASMLGAAGLMALVVDDAGAKKNRKRKKRCKNGANRCGKGCCKTPSVCSAGTCFCTGSEGNCRSVPQELIEIIADALGIPVDQVGENPDQPLAGCGGISQPDKDNIDGLLKLEFGIIQNVPWCDGGIEAGANAIIDQLTQKA